MLSHTGRELWKVVTESACVVPPRVEDMYPYDI
jgi:hypothetical protein